MDPDRLKQHKEHINDIMWRYEDGTLTDDQLSQMTIELLENSELTYDELQSIIIETRNKIHHIKYQLLKFKH